MTKRRVRCGVFTVMLAIGLFAAATRAQENIEEDVAAVKILSPLLGQTHATDIKPQAAVEPTPALPVTQCPAAQGARYLPDINRWYTFARGDEIEYVSQGGFVTWSGQTNSSLRYEDPSFSLSRNLWHHLVSSPFSVCVDSNNAVFAYQWD